MYRPPLELPITPLVPDAQKVADLPKSFEEAIGFLGELADQSSPGRSTTASIWSMPAP
jgi:hypothetical protein